MKLLRLKLNTEFRSLPKGFELYFLRDFDYGEATDFNPYILAGMNGSGKSNVLETLAEIFYHLECIYLSKKPVYFEKNSENPLGFDPKKSTIDAYELEYFTFLDASIFPEYPDHRAHIKIAKVPKERPVITWINKPENFKEQDLNSTKIKSFLPEYTVGYASGNNETLSIPFYKSRILQYDEYLSNLEAKEFISPRPESSLVYLDERYSQAIILTNLLMWDKEDAAEEKILQPFIDYVGLLDVESFRMVIRLDKEISIQPKDEEGEIEVELLQNLNPSEKEHSSAFVRSYIERLKRCSTAMFEESELVDEDILEEELVYKSHLYLDFKVNKATKEAFRFHFENDPLELFEFFQLLLSLDLCDLTTKEKQKIYNSSNIYLVDDNISQLVEDDRILRFKDFKIKKEKLKKPIYTKALSDGEHQFLHALGLCLLFRNKRTLFLLDEPETHFNPDWKAKFISSIRNCLPEQDPEGKPLMREMLITTHSPFLISDSQSKYVLAFKKNKQTNKVDSVKRPEFQTFGSSVNRIGIRIFGMPHTIGEYAQLRLAKYTERYKQLDTKIELEKLLLTIGNEFGDSVERIILTNDIIEKIEQL